MVKSWKPWFAARVRKSKMSDFQKLAQAQYEAQFTPLRNHADPQSMSWAEQQRPYNRPWTQPAIGIVYHDTTEPSLLKKLFGW